MNYSNKLDQQIKNYAETYNISIEEATDEIADIIFNSNCDLLHFFS